MAQAITNAIKVIIPLARKDPKKHVSSTYNHLRGAVFLCHVAASFHFYHDWSHAAAYEHTAEQTAALTGIRWGGGLWLNYLFTLAWIGDVIWWWCRPTSYFARPVALDVLLHGFMAFLAFNSTVVFETGAVRWVGAAVTLGLIGMWIAGRKGR